jgi:hypothetical protein
MLNIIRHPLFVLPVSFVLMWLSAKIGLFLRSRRRNLAEGLHEDHAVIVSATLTLLALIIGFSFSMAIGRYDQRKNYEEEEANAIGTEYVRADLLPTDNATKVRALLKEYLEARILFYRVGDNHELQQVNTRVARLQSDLWSAVKNPANNQPTPIIALAVGGMNDVLNSQGYTQAAWSNRIPPGAWILMIAIAIGANLLVAYTSRHSQVGFRIVILPLILAVAFFLVADIDAPRRGVIRVLPQNLISLAESLH